MHPKLLVIGLMLLVLQASSSQAENLAKEVKTAVEKSTLDQPGTKPFHLKAELAPSFERDRNSGRTGEVDIWWISPSRWRREVKSPEFRQTEIHDRDRIWQKNEGDYFPEWLRRTAIELVNPVPQLDQVLQHLNGAEIRRIGPMTNLSWTLPSGTAEVPNVLRSSLALQNGTGLLLYASGPGWGGELKDNADFHGRKIARTVNVGSPQVTAKVIALEDIQEPPAGFFDVAQQGGDSQLLQTVYLDETLLRKNLLAMQPISWPPVQDGPFQGKVTTEIVIDREGAVHDLESIVTENPGMSDAGRQAIAALRFKPFLLNGVPVQAVSQITIPFKTMRPAGAETFNSAQTYFERARKVGFLAAATSKPYLLKAEFEARSNHGSIEKGRYEDTWLSESQWKREIWFTNSHYLRSREGEKTYQLAEGEDTGILRFVTKALEPIPAIDTFVESDWRIKRDTVNGVATVRVLTGYESPEGKLDTHARGYWFDEAGLLVKTYFNGAETQRLDPEDYGGIKVTRRIDVLKDGKLAMRISITEISATVSEKDFKVPGHEWARAFTDEVR